MKRLLSDYRLGNLGPNLTTSQPKVELHQEKRSPPPFFAAQKKPNKIIGFRIKVTEGFLVVRWGQVSWLGDEMLDGLDLVIVETLLLIGYVYKYFCLYF